MATCACPVPQAQSQRQPYGGYMEVPNLPQVPEQPCVSSQRGPPLCPPAMPPCNEPPSQQSCPPMMMLQNVQQKIQEKNLAQSMSLGLSPRGNSSPKFQTPSSPKSALNQKNANAYIPAPCACPENMLPKDPPPPKKPDNYKGMPAYCGYLGEPKAKVEEEPPKERELLHTSRMKVDKYCRKEPCSCIAPLKTRNGGAALQKLDKCPCNNRPQMITQANNVSGLNQIMQSEETCVPGCKTQNNECNTECRNQRIQNQGATNNCDPYFGSEEWGAMNNVRPRVVDINEQTKANQEWKPCPQKCPGYSMPEPKLPVQNGVTNQTSVQNAVANQPCVTNCPGYERREVPAATQDLQREDMLTKMKSAPTHQHCTIIDRNLPKKYPEALCYCPIYGYKSSVKDPKACPHDNPNCKCSDFVPGRDPIKEIDRSARCPKGKPDCSCPESELLPIQALDPCTGDPKQVGRDKPFSPGPAVADNSCYLPETEAPQDRFAAYQNKMKDSVACGCPEESHSPHSKGAEVVAQPMNRTVEAQAACQPPPCVCDVAQCQEKPQPGAPCILPEMKDLYPPQEITTAEGQESKQMGVIGPWATGVVDWGPLAGLTGTRPVVDRYSISRYSEGEWRKHNCDVIGGSSNENHHAKVVDFNGRQCSLFTAADTDKKQNDNTKRLSQRAHDLHRWKVEVERAINAMALEVNTIGQQRQRLKNAMGVLRMPESIAGECLDLRTQRLEPDLCRDKAEEELIKERSLINEVRDLMERMLNQMEEQLRHNKAIKQQLEMDWSDKKESYEIEAINIGLRNTSKTLLFKPGATRFPDGQSTPESWERYTRENLSLLEAERNRSVELRHFLNSFMNDIGRDLRMQADRVDTALAMRIAETDEARQRLENELLKSLRRIADTEKLISDLRQAIRNQDAAMKKAQTRLDNRFLRPRQENCRDVPQYGLVDEVKSISESVSALKAQLQQAEDSLYGLLTTRGDLEREIIVKRKTLFIDRDRCQEVRSHYPSTVALSGH